MNNKKFVIATLVAAIAVSAPVAADWTKAASLLVGDKSAQNGAFEAQDALLAKFVASSQLIADAQLLAAKSLKLDELVAKMEAENTAKQGVAVDQISTIAAHGATLSAELQKDGAQLDDESKKLYLEALVQYAAGLVATKSVVDTAPGFISSAKNTISSASITEKLSVTKKLEDGFYIAKELPGYAKSLWETSSVMMSFAKSNNIEVPVDATKALTDISFN
ncbi:MAG: hypothetical protein KKE30_21085 [Gammaproteobacteria bacterium]|nr:hypothetical protein [Gammaproteobacteria bacterium]MBU2224631.1 hypothetical protein [Gammaproteobacteria bacterium]